MEAYYKEKIEKLMFKYEEEQKRCTKLRTELREAHNLLCLVDLSSNLRLQVWQSRAKDAEKKVSENSSLLQGRGGGTNEKKSNNAEEGSEILGQTSLLSDGGSRIEDDTNEQIDDRNSGIIFDEEYDNRKSKNRRFNRGGLLLDEESSKDIRDFPVWDDNQ